MILKKEEVPGVGLYPFNPFDPFDPFDLLTYAINKLSSNYQYLIIISKAINWDRSYRRKIVILLTRESSIRKAGLITYLIQTFTPCLYLFLLSENNRKSHSFFIGTGRPTKQIA